MSEEEVLRLLKELAKQEKEFLSLPSNETSFSSRIFFREVLLP
jgi:hypothetical protein